MPLRTGRTKNAQGTNAILAELADIMAENPLSMESLLPALARLVRKIVDYELFAVLLRVKATPYLQVSFVTGHGEKPFRNRRIRIGRGITGTAASTRKTVNVNDVRRDPRYIPVIKGVLAEMAVPLIARGRVVGVIDFESTRADAFGSRERSLLRLVAARIAQVLDSARTHRETTVWNRTLSTLVKLSREFSTVLNLRELLEHIASLIRHLVHYDAFSIFLLDSSAGVLRQKMSVRHDQRVGLVNVPLSEGVGGAAVRTASPALVSDTLQDSRYLPAIEGIRSEIAIPLMLRDKVIGVLHIESQKTGFFTKHHMRTLSWFAPQVAAAIENARLYESVASHEARLAGDLAAAREVQQSLLGTAPDLPGIETAAFNLPALSVSGDLYDFLTLQRGLLRSFIGDVSGKGAAAALYAALANGVIRQVASSDLKPSAVLATANGALAERRVGSRYMTATLVDWRSQESCLVVSNAGAPSPILVRSGKAEPLRIEGFPLGLFSDADYEDTSIRVGPGDILALVSDGIVECCDSGGREYGTERLLQTIATHAESSASVLVQKIFESVRNYGGGDDPQDDQTLIVFKVSAAGQGPKRIVHQADRVTR